MGILALATIGLAASASPPGRAERNAYVPALSVDYRAIVRGLGEPPRAVDVGARLLEALSDRYERENPNCALHEFVESGATFLFDFASSIGAPQEDRTIAAWAVTPATVAKRDVAYQRGFPLARGPEGQAVDRGHLIPHLSGGLFGPNMFRQNRALNRGWSTQGRQYRALERSAAANPGALYFGHLMYNDCSAYPSEIETGLLVGTELVVNRYNNRPTRGD